MERPQRAGRLNRILGPINVHLGRIPHGIGHCSLLLTGPSPAGLPWTLVSRSRGRDGIVLPQPATGRAYDRGLDRQRRSKVLDKVLPIMVK